MKRKRNSFQGFLLVEMVAALALLSGLILVISFSLWNNILWNHEAQARLKALDIVLSHTAKQKTLSGLCAETDGYSLVAKTESVGINQENIDKEIPPCLPKNSKPQKIFQPVSLQVEWMSAGGKKRSVQLVTATLEHEDA